jgi:hypothetical protein
MAPVKVPKPRITIRFISASGEVVKIVRYPLEKDETKP